MPELVPLPTNTMQRFASPTGGRFTTEHLANFVVTDTFAMSVNFAGYGYVPVRTLSTTVPSFPQYHSCGTMASQLRSTVDVEVRVLLLKKHHNQIVRCSLSKTAALAIFKRSTMSAWGTCAQLTKPVRDEDVAEMKNAQADEFLEEIYRFEKLGESQVAAFKVYDHIEKLLHVGAFGLCNTLLERVDAAKLTTSLMRSFLTITFLAKDRLPARASLFTSIQGEMTRIRGEEITRRLLSRLA
jgi:hypothetical protein